MQTADPAVSRRKFEREVSQLREIEPTLISRGWWIMRAEFPIVKVAFAATGMQLNPIPFAVLVDFSDYDARPLSITFVHPFEDRELTAAEMPTKLPRRLPLDPAATSGGPETLPYQIVELYQHYAHLPTQPGFLCLPGTRAYHDHPAHSGDPWELHRHTGEGRLFALLDTIWRYGPARLTGFNFNINMVLAQSEPPE